MYPKKRRATFIPVPVESKPPSITDYHRAQTAIYKAIWVWDSGRKLASK